MSELAIIISSWAIIIGVVAVVFAALWAAFGRKKRSEEKAIGILRPMAVFKGMIWPTNMSRHR